MPADHDSLIVGQRVIWRRVRRGGYGYIERIPGIVRRIGKRVTLCVTLASGNTKLVGVKRESIVTPEDILDVQIAAGAKDNPYANY